MNEEQELSGRVMALSMTLAAVIQSLPKKQLENAAQALRAAHECARQHDDQYLLPEAGVRARDALVAQYLGQLSPVQTGTQS